MGAIVGLWIATLLFAYLLGSIPTAYLVVWWRRGQDVRNLGDGNAGAANVARILGTPVGISVGLFDIAKGAVAVALANWLVGTGMAMLAGVLAIAGHNWPVYLLGKGGRGAATAIGALLAILPLVALPLALVALAILYLTRSSTKAVACFYIPLPLLAFWPGGYTYPYVAFSLLIPILVGISHYISLRLSRKGLTQ